MTQRHDHCLGNGCVSARRAHDVAAVEVLHARLLPFSLRCFTISCDRHGEQGAPLFLLGNKRRLFA